MGKSMRKKPVPASGLYRKSQEIQVSRYLRAKVKDEVKTGVPKGCMRGSQIPTIPFKLLLKTGDFSRETELMRILIWGQLA